MLRHERNTHSENRDSDTDQSMDMSLQPSSDTGESDSGEKELGYFPWDSLINPDEGIWIFIRAQCVDSTVDAHGILSVGFPVTNGGHGNLPCGIKKTGNTYDITVAVLGTNNRTAVKFKCITSGTGANLNFPSNLTIANFETGQIVPRLAFSKNQEKLRFEVFHADGNKVPSQQARVGELLLLRAIYDKDFLNGPDNWGRVFHVTFVPHDSAEMSLLIVTPGLGTWVKVTGSLPGQTFSRSYPIKRNVDNMIIIPDTYKPYRDANDKKWYSQKIAVKVEVGTDGDVIAIRALSKKRSGSEAGAFIALPDDVLGKKYNCYTGSIGRQDGLVLVYAVRDTTTLTINFNSFMNAGLKINDKGAGGGNSNNLVMNEGDVLTMQCDDECHVIELEANQPIGVVTGRQTERITNGGEKDHYASQLPPLSTYGKQFVLVEGFDYLVLLGDPTATVGYMISGGTTTNRPNGESLSSVNAAELYTFTAPVLLLAIPDSNSKDPFTMPYPSTYQWSTRQYVFVKMGESYSFTVLAYTGELAKIEFRDTNGATGLGPGNLGMFTGFSATTVLGRGSQGYERYTFNPTNPVSKGPALIELKSGSNNKPFMLIVDVTIPGHNKVKYVSIGTRFPTINPCVPFPAAANSFGNGLKNTPGDMLDNDCDGLIDEENDDGSNNGGNDLAPRPINPNVGIYVDTLIVSNNAKFLTDGTAQTRTLMTNGCSNTIADILSIQPFKWNKNIGAQFTTYHVIETQPFRAFYLGTPIIYFRVTIGFCYGNLTGGRCDKSCQNATVGRKRRDADETATLDTQLIITDVDPGLQTGFGEPCHMNRLYYIPTALLTLTIFVLAFMNGVFLYLKASLEKLD